MSFYLTYNKDVQNYLVALVKEAFQWAFFTDLAGFIPLAVLWALRSGLGQVP